MGLKISSLNVDEEDSELDELDDSDDSGVSEPDASDTLEIEDEEV
jgi:hypothetical protein